MSAPSTPTAKKSYALFSFFLLDSLSGPLHDFYGFGRGSIGDEEYPGAIVRDAIAAVDFLAVPKHVKGCEDTTAHGRSPSCLQHWRLRIFYGGEILYHFHTTTKSHHSYLYALTG